jgi:hypothetical protein
VSAYRFPKLYETAIQHLLDLGAVNFEKEPGSRRQWIVVIRISKRYQAARPIPSGAGIVRGAEDVIRDISYCWLI